MAKFEGRSTLAGTLALSEISTEMPARATEGNGRRQRAFKVTPHLAHLLSVYSLKYGSFAQAGGM